MDVNRPIATIRDDKDGRHLHAGSMGGYRLAYLDCACWEHRGGYSHALSPLPEPTIRTWLLPPPVMTNAIAGPTTATPRGVR